MGKGFVIAALGILLILGSQLAQQLDLGISIFELHVGVLDSPESGGIGGFFSSILQPFIWVFNVLATLFQIMTFQAEGIPPLAAVIFTGIAVYMLYQTVRLVRGGG